MPPEPPATTGVADEKRYEFVTSQLRYTNDRIIEAFELFLKLTAAVLGGGAWVATTDLEPATQAAIGHFVPWLITGIGVSCLSLIAINLRSWWGYRKAESELVGQSKVPLPRVPWSCSGEIVFSFIIIAAVVAIWCYNPFSRLGEPMPTAPAPSAAQSPAAAPQKSPAAILEEPPDHSLQRKPPG